MDFNRIITFIKHFASELFLILCGAVLLFFPNSAVALVTKVMAWILIGSGVLGIIKNLDRKKSGFDAWIWPIGYLLVGFFLLSNPLAISDLAGRVLGLFLMITGVQKFREASYGSGKALGLVSLVSGVVLMALPKTLINTLLGFCGIVLIVIGAINLIDKLRHDRYLDEGRDPNIIDADE